MQARQSAASAAATAEAEATEEKKKYNDNYENREHFFVLGVVGV